jgi:hypothetical protein
MVRWNWARNLDEWRDYETREAGGTQTMCRGQYNNRSSSSSNSSNSNSNSNQRASWAIEGKQVSLRKRAAAGQCVLHMGPGTDGDWAWEVGKSRSKEALEG